MYYYADILGNQSNTVELTYYVPVGVDSSLVQCSWALNGTAITADGTKYVQPNPRRLRINNIVSTDEGRYTCGFNYNKQPNVVHVADVFVLGKY